MCTMTKADSSISCHAQAMTKRGENARPRFSKQAWSFDFGEAGRMIGERRNAVCEIRPHDRHELCARMRHCIVGECLDG